MTVRRALRAALVDTYRWSWRLVIVNAALSLAVALIVVFVSAFPLVLFVAPLVAGPVFAALVHCVVTLVREDEFHLSDAGVGVRRFWKEGFVLGGITGAILLLGALAVIFYGSERHRVLPLAVLAVYLVALLTLVVLVGWLFAVADSEVGVVAALRRAALVAGRSPARLLVLGSALFLINLVGTVTVIPLLTLTVAYTLLATARLVLPPEEVTA
jgi:hypothetical protein